MNKAHLLAKINTAFSNVPYPGDNHLGDLSGRDDSENVTALFKSRAWQSLEPDELWPLALYYMTPEALHYYFPAYLITSLKTGYGDVLDVIIDCLTPPQDVSDTEAFQKKFQLFSTEQRNVISLFLEGIIEESRLHQKNNHPIVVDESLLNLQNFWRKM